MLSLAAAAPDHGQLTPWRFVLVPTEQRHRLAEVFALSLVDRDPGATEAQVADAREKAYRAPLLLVAIASLGSREPDTPALERMVSMGAAIQNLLLGAHAMGFGTGLTSGRAMASPHTAATVRPGRRRGGCVLRQRRHGRQAQSRVARPAGRDRDPQRAGRRATARRSLTNADRPVVDARHGSAAGS